MTEKIGNVVLNLKYYSGTDLYSDGSIEDVMLDICKNGQKQYALEHETAWPILYHFSPIRHHVLDWYPMNPDASVLEIGAGCGAITGILSKKVKRVVCIELSKRRSMINAYQNQDCNNVEIYVGKYEDVKLEEKFDYITLIGVLEYATYYTSADNPFQAMLEQIQTMLKPGGKLLIAIENRMGLKYINGAKEDHTGKWFDGIHDYANKSGARTFTKAELTSILQSAGYSTHRFWGMLPDYKLPYAVISGDFVPNVGGFRGYDTTYDGMRYQFSKENMLWDAIAGERSLVNFANSFFVEAGVEVALTDVRYVRYSIFRENKFHTRTMIKQDKGQWMVTKTPMNPQAETHVHSMMDKYQWIKDIYREMHVIPPKIEAGGVAYPVVEGDTVHNILWTYRFGKDGLLQAIDKYTSRILNMQESAMTTFSKTDEFVSVFGDADCEGEPAVKVGNIDSNFDNVVENNGELYCYDYEWTFPFAVPIGFIRFRMLKTWYGAVQDYVPFEDAVDFLVATGFSYHQIDTYMSMERSFMRYVRERENNCLENYGKSYVTFDQLTESFDQINHDKQSLEEMLDKLYESRDDLQKKLDRHTQNEERLRKAIKRLEVKLQS